MQVGSKIQLKEEFASIYPRAESGATGWVVDSKRDEVDYEFIRVRWDQDDWRTDNEQEGWTFPQHFDVIEEQQQPESLDPNGIVERTFQLIQDNMNHDAQPDITAQIEEYVNTLMQAHEQASDAEAFLMVTVKKHYDENYDPNRDSPIYVPEVTISSQNPEAESVIKLHILQLAMSLHQEMMFQQQVFFEDLNEDDEGDEPEW